MKDTSKHPCFNKGAAGKSGRVHLPVAPQCNIKCNYCNRKYDCVNESRPGVASAVLKPFQAAEYMDKVLEKAPYISVAGIAGPGDPFANAPEVLETMRLLKEKHPDLIFCLSSNGLNVPFYLDEIAALGVTHMTITMSAIDPAIGAKLYAWVKDGKVVYQGEQAAKLLFDRQVEAIKGLKERGITVKVNTIIVPGVNDDHIEEVSQFVATLGVDIQNLIPLKPSEGTPFVHLQEPSHDTVAALRKIAGAHVKQMTHCQRCRADAVGLLCDDKSTTDLCGTLRACAALKPLVEPTPRPYVAVATREGMLVNLHLGEAERFQIWGMVNGNLSLVEERQAPKAGCGTKRWDQLAATLHDCRAVLASAMGEQPRTTLEKHGLNAYVCSGFIEEALHTVMSGGDMTVYKARKAGIGGSCCGGTGLGCG
ncbi:MAG: radical SAM protein [Pseudomonadota bacterium]